MTIRRKVISLHCPASEVRETSQHLPTRTSKQRGTSKFMIPVPLFDLKFLPELAPSAVGTSNRRTGDLIVTSEISDRLLRMDHAAESRDSGAGGGPLHGIRVVDLTRVYSGPYCTFLLAMAGADVIKVEPPEGDSLRNRKRPGGAALPFAMLNANKRMVTSEAVQIHGGYGFTDDYAVSRLYRGARHGSLGGGTSETLRDLIGKRLLADLDDKDGLLSLGET